MSTRAGRVTAMVLILVLASVCALADARYRVEAKSSGFLITGPASNVDRLRETFEVTDRGVTYTVLTGRASIQLDTGTIGATQDLRDSFYVQVSGEQLSARTILATTVVVLNEKAASAADSRSYRPNDYIETSGLVTGVSASSREIDVRTDDGNFALMVRPDTVIRRYIYVTDIGDINEGDDVSFSGRMAQDGRIVAARIQVSASGNKARPVGSKAYRPTYLSAVSHGREDSIEGGITSPPSSFDRTLMLSTEFGERRVDVLKSAEVRIDRLPASVHDLTKGDRVRVFGTWDGDTMVATRVETYLPSASATYRVPEPPAPEPAPSAPQPMEQPSAPVPPASDPEPPAPAEPAAPETANPSVITGRIVDIDYTKLDLSVDAGLKDNKVDAREAVVTREGSTRRFSELKKGDKVEVKGDWNGDVLKAVSVDVVE